MTQMKCDLKRQLLFLFIFAAALITSGFAKMHRIGPPG